MNRWGWLCVAVAASACAGQPPPAEVPLAPALPTASERVDEPRAPRKQAPDSEPDESPRAPCEELARATLKGRIVRVCLEHEVDPEDGTHLATRIEEVDGKVLLEPGWIMSFLATFAAAPKVAFRDITGDGVPDVTIAAPSGGASDPNACQYMVDGAELVRERGDDDSNDGAPLKVGASFAAAVSEDADPWSMVKRSPPISTKDACAIIRGARSIAGLRKRGSANVEIVDFNEPGHPHCMKRAARRGITRERVAEIDPDACRSLTCDERVGVCRNHEPDPSAQYYLFERGSDGRSRLRAVALYNGS